MSRKPLAEKVREEVEARRKLDAVLPCLIEPGDDHVHVTTLRRLLRLCGLNPTTPYLTECVTRMGSYFLETRITDQNRRVVILPGMKLVEDGVKKARKALMGEWRTLLAAEGMGEEPEPVPLWHKPTPNMNSLIILPDDWADGTGEHGKTPSLRDRIFQTHANREAAGVYNATMEDYLWRGCDWRKFKASDRLVVELHVVDGLTPREISAKTGMVYQTVKLALQRHRALAGFQPRGRKAKK